MVTISDDIGRDLGRAVKEACADRVVLLADATTAGLCVPKVRGVNGLEDVPMISIGAGDSSKTLDSVAHVWRELGALGCTRHSLLVNVGGGMVTDLGGFAASTFKRGIRYVNVPTTLLSMVDASVGGKTGFNFGGLKNEIGVFSDASEVIISTGFLDTLDCENVRSGYAEMLKHSLLKGGDMFVRHLGFDLGRPDMAALANMVGQSVDVKKDIVARDPHESGIRKALNLGHTAGHAFESLALERNPVLHGYAVAWGMVVELYLSAIKCGFATDILHCVTRYIRDYYGTMAISCKDYGRLTELMSHDKKNTAGSINFTLLGAPGDIRIDQTATAAEIEEALDFYCFE